MEGEAMNGVRKALRFSLASLLGFVTLAAMLLGYAKWKYKQLAIERAALARERIGVAYKEKETSWIENLVTNRKKSQKPTRAAFRVYQDGGEIRVGNLESKRVGRDELEPHMAPLMQRLINLGVEELSIIVYYEDTVWWKQALPIIKGHGFKNFYQRQQKVPIRGRSYWMVDASQKLK
jgi:hypothetical protein